MKNEEKLKEKLALKYNNLGVGKVKKTVDKVFIGMMATLEAVKELPGMEYLRTLGTTITENEITAFLTKIAIKFPWNKNLNPEQLIELQNTIGNTFGVAVAELITFVFAHPTLFAVGAVAATSAIVVAWKKFRQRHIEEKLSKTQ